MKTRANAVIGDNRTRYACIPGNRSHYTEIFFRYGVTKRDFFQLLLSSLLLLLSFQFFTSFKIQRRDVFFSRNSWIGGLAKYAEYRSFEVGTTRALFLETTITITKLQPLQHSTYVRYTYSVYETENEDLGGLWKTG